MANDGTALNERTWRIGRAAAGALGLSFAILYLIEGRDLDLGRMGAPGPGVFPLGVGVIFALVSIGVIVDALGTSQPGKARFPEGDNLRRLLLVSVCFLAYVLLLNVLGFFIATLAMVACFTRIVGKLRWHLAAVSGATVALSVWTVFTLILGVRLPTAIFWS